MWEELLELFDSIVGKDIKSYLKDKISQKVSKVFFEKDSNFVKDWFRRRMKRPTSFSFSNRSNIATWWSKWLKTTSKNEIQQTILDTMSDYMRDELKMNNHMIKVSLDNLESKVLKEQDIKDSRKKGGKHKPYKWYYLTNTHNSDNAIYRMRRKHISTNLEYVELQIQFIKGNGTIYSYKHIPYIISVVMTIIGLRYVTKNAYLAGAYNYFWYAWWNKQPANTIGKSSGFAFLNKSPKLVEKIRQERLTKLEPIHRKMKYIRRQKKW